MNGEIYQFKREDAFSFAKHVGIPAREYGNELWLKICPYCRKDDRNKKKFSINLETGQFHCFRASCAAHGNMITLAKDFGFKLDRATNVYYGIEHRYFRRFPKRTEPIAPKPFAVKFMAGRGISEAVVERYQLTTKKNDETVLVFPFINQDGNIEFIKYRNTDADRIEKAGKEWCEKDCKPILFGMYQCNTDNSRLIITEGQIDSLSVSESGIENAVSVPLGANGFTWIPYCWDWVLQFKEMVVFGDHEHGHITLLDELARRFGGNMIIKHVQPEAYRDCKDANEILQRYGPEAVREAVETAEIVPDRRVVDVSAIDYMSITEKEHFSTGIGHLDGMIGGYYMGDLNVITGKRGEGKSTLASQMLTFALKNGYPVFAYSGELDNVNFAEWFYRQIAGARHINKIDRGKNELPLYSIEAEALEKIRRWIHGKAFLYSSEIITDGKTEQEALIEVVEKAVKQYGCRVILIDNLMTAISGDARYDINQQQTEFVRKLKSIAQTMDACIILVAHPRKGAQVDSDDIAGSANITNLADTVICYSRDKEDHDGTHRTLKVFKNRKTGKIDTEGVLMNFQESSKRISLSNTFDFECGWEKEPEPEYSPIENDMGALMRAWED